MNKRIIYQSSDGGVHVVIPNPTSLLSLEQIAAKSVPTGTPYRIINTKELPTDRFFRNAWEVESITNDLSGTSTKSIRINLEKAKNIAHDIRRIKREEEFAPYDNIIAKQIPGNSAQQAESERQKIRDKYATMQQQIDNSTTPEQIKTALGVQ